MEDLSCKYPSKLLRDLCVGVGAPLMDDRQNTGAFFPLTIQVQISEPSCPRLLFGRLPRLPLQATDMFVIISNFILLHQDS